MTADRRYALESSTEERRRLSAQASAFRTREAELLRTAGVVAGADVADLGCGPATTLRSLRPLVGPGARLVGVDSDAAVVRGAGELGAAGSDEVEVRQGDAEDSGLDRGSFDTVIISYVLVHNGGREQRIVDHAASLLRPGGGLVVHEQDITMMRIRPRVAPVVDLYERFELFLRAEGHDPQIGLRLPDLCESAGLRVEEYLPRPTILRRRAGARGPAWAARSAMQAAGLASAGDLEQWELEFADLDAASEQPRYFMSGFTALAVRDG